MKLTSTEEKLIIVESKLRQVWLEKVTLQAIVDKERKGERNVLRDNINNCCAN
jgi:hypothetical protein